MNKVDRMWHLDVCAGKLVAELEVSISEGSIEELLLPSYRAFMCSKGEPSSISHPYVNGRISDKLKTFFFRTREDLKEYVRSLDDSVKSQVKFKY